ncbi:hypothetical protein U14_01171 [Candidatus Moduliflexus flocculans]|uniref:GTPase-associated protein 1 N-terminal domain-containing protein n=1 Tax=Candidatus Moduliflexus flocculans TaxID=1499966 RepID=A0A0S6VRI1_9BACT|nr:hypothetical protein U14_01171 [Candidatus Moduliflexus flocculans]
MKVEQQMFTSGKPEFVTVAITAGLSRDERITLERHSLYLLPTALMYQENVVTPVKYVFYPLHAKRGVVGKAIYAGKDSLGRPGNYFFHNLVFEFDDLQQEFDLNPAALIRAIEQQQHFRTTAPQTPLTPEEIASLPRLSEMAVPRIKQAELEQLLYVGLNFKSFQLPLLLYGTDCECLDLLERLYPLLPYQQRREFSFDTYSYGTGLTFRVQGLPPQPEFRQSFSPALTLNCSTLQVTAAFQMPAPPARFEAIRGLVLAGKTGELNALYALEHWLELGNFDEFTRRFGQTSAEIQHLLRDFHAPRLLAYLVEQRQTALFELLQPYLTSDDLAILSAAPELMRRYAEQADDRRAAIFAEWIAKFKRFSGDDLFLLPEEKRGAAIRILLDEMLKMPKSKEKQAQLEAVIRYAIHAPGMLLAVLQAVNPSDLGKQERAELKRLFETIPTAQKSPQILAEIERILQPPASFLQRISKKLGRSHN